MAISRRVLEEVPGFDPELGPGQLGTMEDTLFSWQLREAGYRIEMVTETAVEHHFDEERLTQDEFIRAAIARGRSLSRTSGIIGFIIPVRTGPTGTIPTTSGVSRDSC